VDERERKVKQVETFACRFCWTPITGPVFTPGDRDGEGYHCETCGAWLIRAEAGAPWLADETEDQPDELPP
jgi:hypothetical protein